MFYNPYKIYVTLCSVRVVVPYSENVQGIDSFPAFGERKFGELIDQPIGYQFS